jgi:acetyl-CoA carboxylase biotin carboxylase subunit
MFEKIIVANRGEIAVRIIRACRDLRIQSVVVYSEADRDSLAVKLADEALCIGKPQASLSYLNGKRIIEAALESGAEAIHPGYGFLAENSQFVRACRQAGLVFIGPSAQSMDQMGRKVPSRRTVAQAGVPVVPGSEGVLESISAALQAAGQIGYPLILKASSGGGGKGMRIVESDAELKAVYETTRSEAQSSFADSAVYLERYIEKPRHIEVQVLGDHFGNLIHLGERECSIQRRHQKLVEECPSPLVTSEFRSVLGKAALDVARAVDYHSAGTVEFLVDAAAVSMPPPFYFLEMNTRLQVEHPVTEMVTGVDLVRQQILVAAGEELQHDQDAIRFRGAAIECRIYAEDPQNNFFPSPGRITTLFEPSGPGTRNDSGVCAGFHIPIDYDPLISKLVTHGENRGEAISRMSRALREYRIGGVRTTIPFFEALLCHPKFIAADLHTHFIQEHALTGQLPQQDWHTVPAVCAALFHLLERPDAPRRAEPRSSNWKEIGRFENRFSRSKWKSS